MCSLTEVGGEFEAVQPHTINGSGGLQYSWVYAVPFIVLVLEGDKSGADFRGLEKIPNLRHLCLSHNGKIG